MGQNTTNSQKKLKLKKNKKIDNFQLDENLIRYINWFSMYNLASKGMVLKMCLGLIKKILLKKTSKYNKTN